MTREEAIEILNRDDDSMRKGYFCINDFEAIEVLKSEESCEDCISREQALKCFTWTNTKDDVYYAIKALSSVQPKPKTDVLDKIRAEIIARNRNIKAVRSDGCCFFITDEILNILDKYRAEKEGI